MKTDSEIEEITAAVEQLRAVSRNGPARRRLLDRLFRSVHDLKAKAAANGLGGLATAAHEFENVLHEMRIAGASDALAEGARFFLVRTSFNIANFEQRFQSLKETLNQSGEIISISPTTDGEHNDKLNFRILYAHTSNQELPSVADVTLEETSLPAISGTSEQFDAAALERCFEKLAKEVSLRDAPIDDPFQQALRAGQAAALATGKEVDFELRAEDLLLDKTLRNAIATPLIHLVRNAVDHGIEQKGGKVVIEALADNHQIRIKVTDDGRGIHPEIIKSMFQPGFSTATKITETSGRGVGLDAVKSTVESLGGAITVTSAPGEGTCFEITLPISLHPR